MFGGDGQKFQRIRVILLVVFHVFLYILANFHVEDQILSEGVLLEAAFESMSTAFEIRRPCLQADETISFYSELLHVGCVKV